MKLCFLLASYNKFGGVERVVINLANLLSKNKDVHITLFSYCDDGENGPFMIDDSIELKHIYNRPIPLHRGFIPAVRNLNKDIRLSNYDILVGCSSMYFPLAVCGTLFLNCKLVLWEHSHFFLNTEVRFQRYCRKFWVEFASAIVVLTNTDRINYLNNIKNRNVFCINNMLDRRLINNASKYNQQSKSILSVGRLCPVKNFHAIIEIGRQLFFKYPEWKWDIWGDGEMRSLLQTAINEAGLQNYITLKGWSDNIYDLYQNYSIFISTSKNEGFGLAILEALANRLPVVAFDVLCGPKEMITNGVNGFLISDLNIKKMEAAISELIENPSKRQEFSDATQNNLNQFSEEVVLRKWMTLVENVTKRIL